ncbi:MAG: hypothetical protein RMJ98_01660, partial [Myxococcales bacterium]|nr:hypothetical protein [Polyangiaceae bacterium]MDW8247993.1 hypothetical protein [Myxococcales bacterium]
MTHWLFTQVRTLGALAGLALLLGLSAPASAREARPAGSAEAKKKANGKGKRTARTAPKGKKAQEKKG